MSYMSGRFGISTIQGARDSRFSRELPSAYAAIEHGLLANEQLTLFLQISSGLIFVTMGYIAMSYSEERDRGKYITISVNLQAVGSLVAGLIALIINRDSVSSTQTSAEEVSSTDLA